MSHVFTEIKTQDVKRDGKTITDIPRPQFKLNQDGLENAIAYYGSVETLVNNLNRMIDTDCRNWVAATFVLDGKDREETLEAMGYEEVDDGHIFANFNAGKGQRSSDPVNQWLKVVKDKDATPEEKLHAIEQIRKITEERIVK